MTTCPFCDLAIVGRDEDVIVLRTPNVFVVPALKQRARNRGHMLVLPTAHVTRLIDTDASLRAELYGVAGRVSMAVREAFGATGAMIFQNEEVPGQVLFHLHVHVVPRREGDEFKMPDGGSAELGRGERVGQVVEMRQVIGQTEQP